MNFKNCERCKKPFSTTGTAKYCPSCVAKIEEEIEKLTDLISFNKSITLAELIEKTEISEKSILKYVQSGKIPKIEGINFSTCKKCGVEITTGNYCSKCMLTMAKL